MHADVVDLRRFYDGSLGQVVRRLIRRRIRELWPDVRGQRVLGLGYATPYLRPFRDEAERVMAIMPAEQGCTFWPAEGPGLVALADDSDLPLPDYAVDRVLLVHGLECTQQLKPLIREVWRVMAGGGRMIVVVPNRRGLWARSENTPFGYGSPYTQSQIKRLLKESNFKPERECRALYLPPMQSRVLLAGAGAWEQVGDRWCKPLAGVHLIEATKQIYITPEAMKVRARRRYLRPYAQPAFGRLAAE